MSSSTASPRCNAALYSPSVPYGPQLPSLSSIVLPAFGGDVLCARWPFPIGALSDPRVFYDAVDDEEKFRANLDRMMKTVERFLEMPATDVTPMSEYVYER